MTTLICEYCKNTYSSKSSLNNHQKTTKKCLEIQKSLNKITDIVEFSCKYCDKKFTSNQNIKKHEIFCNVKKRDEITELTDKYENKIIELKDKYDFETTKLKLLNEKYLEEIHQLKETIAGLQGEMRIMSKSNDCVYEIAKQPKNNNITNNNSTNSSNKITNSNSKTVNIAFSLNFKDIDKVKEIIQQKYDITHILAGQKGCAQFAVKHLLSDDDGNCGYICTDPSRNSFKFKNEDGIIEKDLEAKKLTNYLVNGGLYEKTRNLGLDWCHDDGVVNQEKFHLISEKQLGIMNLKENNSEFKKELSSLIT